MELDAWILKVEIFCSPSRSKGPVRIVKTATIWVVSFIVLGTYIDEHVFSRHQPKVHHYPFPIIAREEGIFGPAMAVNANPTLLLPYKQLFSKLIGKLTPRFVYLQIPNQWNNTFL